VTEKGGSASFTNGVLEVRLKKSVEEKKKQIPSSDPFRNTIFFTDSLKSPERTSFRQWTRRRSGTT